MGNTHQNAAGNQHPVVGHGGKQHVGNGGDQQAHRNGLAIAEFLEQEAGAEGNGNGNDGAQAFSQRKCRPAEAQCFCDRDHMVAGEVVGSAAVDEHL